MHEDKDRLTIDIFSSFK